MRLLGLFGPVKMRRTVEVAQDEKRPMSHIVQSIVERLMFEHRFHVVDST